MIYLQGGCSYILHGQAETIAHVVILLLRHSCSKLRSGYSQSSGGPLHRSSPRTVSSVLRCPTQRILRESLEVRFILEPECVAVARACQLVGELRITLHPGLVLLEVPVLNNIISLYHR